MVDEAKSELSTEKQRVKYGTVSPYENWWNQLFICESAARALSNSLNACQQAIRLT